MSSKNFNIKLEEDIKEKSELIYKELGIDLNTAINIFLRKSIEVNGFPFDVRIDKPNKETLFALLESEKISYDKNIKAFDVEDALKELKN